MGMFAIPHPTRLDLLVSARYEKGSMILTSNKSIGEWGELTGDPVLATAVLDRLLHHCHVINIRDSREQLSPQRQNQNRNLFDARCTGGSILFQLWWVK